VRSPTTAAARARRPRWKDASFQSASRGAKTIAKTATSGQPAGSQDIDRQSKTRRRGPVAALAAIALALGVLAAPASSPAASIGVGRGIPIAHEDIGPPPKPQLLLFHGGSFLFQNPFFEPAVVARSIAAGFEPHFIDYPLGNVPAAVENARAE